MITLQQLLMTKLIHFFLILAVFRQRRRGNLPVL